MKYPKLWNGPHAIGEALTRAMNRVRSPFLSASGVGYSANKIGRRSEVFHGEGDIYVTPLREQNSPLPYPGQVGWTKPFRRKLTPMIGSEQPFYTFGLVPVAPGKAVFLGGYEWDIPTNSPALVYTQTATYLGTTNLVPYLNKPMSAQSRAGVIAGAKQVEVGGDRYVFGVLFSGRAITGESEEVTGTTPNYYLRVDSSTSEIISETVIAPPPASFVCWQYSPDQCATQNILGHRLFDCRRVGPRRLLAVAQVFTVQNSESEAGVVRHVVAQSIDDGETWTYDDVEKGMFGEDMRSIGSGAVLFCANSHGVVLAAVNNKSFVNETMFGFVDENGILGSEIAVPTVMSTSGTGELIAMGQTFIYRLAETLPRTLCVSTDGVTWEVRPSFTLTHPEGGGYGGYFDIVQFSDTRIGISAVDDAEEVHVHVSDDLGVTWEYFAKTEADRALDIRLDSTIPLYVARKRIVPFVGTLPVGDETVAWETML